jgi:hypothetical protein
MPEAEALRAAYRKARVIGEYGSGGSTAFAATECSARVVSIESDRAWVEGLQAWLDGQGLEAGRIDLRHCDIGPTGQMGLSDRYAELVEFLALSLCAVARSQFQPRSGADRRALPHRLSGRLHDAIAARR